MQTKGLTIEPKWPYICTIVLIALALPFLITHNPSGDHLQTTRADAIQDPTLILWLSTSDFLIATSYLVTSTFLAYLAFHLRSVVRFHWAFIMCAALVFTSSLTHAVRLVLMFTPAHLASATVSWLTTSVSIGTALLLPTLIPQIRDLVQRANEAEHDRIRIEQRNLNLEHEVQSRTQEIQASRQHARELVGHVVAAEQNERARLSYDVHDGLTQTAVACFQRISATAYKHAQTGKHLVERGLLDPDLYNEILNDIKDCERLAKLTVLDARTFIEDLRPTVLDDFGLPEAINQKVNQLQDEGWSITFTCTLPDPHYIQRPNPDAETALYRICQESLTNIKKHARATHVNIHLELNGIEGESPQAVLTITDNGHGFDPDLINRNDRSGPGERVGLQGMRERLNLMQGALDIQTAPGKGTTIKATIPIKEPPPTNDNDTNDLTSTSTKRKDDHIERTT